MKTFSHLCQYLAKLFLEWEIFWPKVVEKIKIHFTFSNVLFENRAIYDIMSKKIWWNQRGHKWRHNMAHTSSMLDKQGYVHARTWHTPTRPGTRTHAYTDKYVIYVVFPRQQRFANAPRYTYIVLFHFLIIYMQIYLFLVTPTQRMSKTCPSPERKRWILGQDCGVCLRTGNPSY
jgi:hypothetical protein